MKHGRNLVGAGVILLGKCVQIGVENIPTSAQAKHVGRATTMAYQFWEEPPQMGARMATLWQERARECMESGRFISWTGDYQCWLVQMCLQLSALVFYAAREMGGTHDDEMGFGLVANDDAVQLGREASFWIQAKHEIVQQHERTLGRPLRVDRSPDTMLNLFFQCATLLGVPKVTMDDAAHCATLGEPS